MSEGQNAVVAEFSRRRRKQRIMAIPFLLVVFTFILEADAGQPFIMGIPGHIAIAACIVIICALAIFSLLNWRCPACKKFIKLPVAPKKCAKCGVPLK